MRNLTVVVAWHGGSPKVSINYIDPKDSTFSPENPRRWVLTGSNLSLPMPILLEADAKMMSVDKNPVDCFVSHNCPYHQRVVMGVLTSFQV